jgi:hypothetical protein
MLMSKGMGHGVIRLFNVHQLNPVPVERHRVALQARHGAEPVTVPKSATLGGAQRTPAQSSYSSDVPPHRQRRVAH